MVPLESSKLFNTLPEPDLKIVRAVAKQLQFAPGQTIFKEGDPGDGIYVILSGTVQITAIVEGERRVLSRIGEGDLFGEMAVLDNDPRSATASAEDDVTVIFISRLDLLQLLEKIPQLPACLVREISRRLRDFNRQYIQEVLQAERLAIIGRFARSIVHDLKNPLNIIGLAAELAAMESATPESRASAKVRIRKQVDRISNMVNELLEFTRGSQTPFILARTEYSAFIKQVVDELTPELTAKSVTLEFENAPPSVLVDMNPPRLTRVFHNLAHNATDAMGGGGQIKLRFEVKGRELITEFEDTGPGIATEMLPKLFEAFASYGKAHGTGLGLSICKRIVEDHRGRVYARNEPGGAVFGFVLPLAADS
ncbi:MAG: cyclic nucleotide-binding domain-containing protein [Verrucomicrobia bacterium]|nr:cyclic nucleotide-binding domain-containing protein [Verrucomicrobiota bacterium]